MLRLGYVSQEEAKGIPPLRFFLGSSSFIQILTNKVFIDGIGCGVVSAQLMDKIISGLAVTTVVKLGVLN